MKRLSKTEYELRDLTIFYERTILQLSLTNIAFKHGLSKSMIGKILRKRKEKQKEWLSNVAKYYWKYIGNKTK